MAAVSVGGVRESIGEAEEEPDAEAPQDEAPHDLRYLARQPILDIHGNVHGYELLFRAGPTSTGFSGDGDTATRTVLDNTVIFGLERLSGGQLAFVNCTREALVGRLAMVLPAEHTVLEILETLTPDAELRTACQEFKDLGFRIALDDFAWTPEWGPFVELADYIKVDLSMTQSAERLQLRERLKGSRAQLVAERVETPADLVMARDEGFALFQGFHFCRPVVMKNRAIPSNRLVHIELLQLLHQYPLDVAKVSELVKRDASLTYRLLRVVNSALYGARKEISSIKSALVMIGDAMFRRMAVLAIASELKGHHPTELLRMAFQRGRFCELLAHVGRKDAMEQYLLGVLSLLPTMLNLSIESVAMALPLRKNLRDALLGVDNNERKVLDWLEANEAGAWERCDAIALQAGWSGFDLPRMYAEAVLWAETTLDRTMS